MNSGQFVRFNDPSGKEALGLVLRTSSNEKADGTTDDYVEVVGPLPVVLLTAEEVSLFNEAPKEDPKRIVGGSSGEVSGLDTGGNKK